MPQGSDTVVAVTRHMPHPALHLRPQPSLLPEELPYSLERCVQVLYSGAHTDDAAQSMLWWRRVHAQGPSTPEIPNSDANAMTYALSTNDPPGANAQDDDTQYIGMDVVQTHNLAHDCWVVVDGKVFEWVSWGTWTETS